MSRRSSGRRSGGGVVTINLVTSPQGGIAGGNPQVPTIPPRGPRF